MKIGAVTLGGGLAMLPLVEDEMVRRKKWLTEEEIIDVFAVSQSLPGVMIVNTAIYVGYKVKGMRGAFAALFGSTFAALVTILVIAVAIPKFSGNYWVDKAFAGVRMGISAMVLLSAANLARKSLKNWFPAAVSAVAAVCVGFFGFNAALALLVGGIIGALYYLFIFSKRRDRQ